VSGGRVVVVGSANVDLVVAVPRHPRGGETLLGGSLRRLPGGKGANQAVAAARAGGAPTSFVGAVGRDDDGTLLLDALRADGVDVTAVERAGSPTGTALVMVDGAGENAIVVAPGANADVGPGVGAAVGAAGPAVVLAQLEVPVDAVVAAFRARPDGARSVLNAAPSQALPPDLLAATDVLVVNEHEARDVLAGPDGGEEGDTGDDGRRDGGGDPTATARALAALVPAVVLTLGARGCVVVVRDEEPVRVAAPVVEAVDTTGAGDVLCGVLAARLAGGAPLVDAARTAVVAGALAVTRAGAQPAVPTAREVADGVP
jgi:ribokinase